MKEPNFKVLMLAKGKARVEIYDALGPAWAGMIDTKLVAQHIKDAGELSEIEVRINSPGGSAWEGIGIHNLLKEHPAKVNVVIDGVAASAASLVAMAGDNVRIPANAMLMIHDPMTFAFGGVEDMQKAINSLEAVITSAVASYASKSGQPEDKLKQWMKDETWFVGQEAVDAGFADTTEKELPTAKVEPKASVQQMFSRAPNNFASLLSLSMQSTRENTNMAENDTATPPAQNDNQAPPTAPPALTAADVQNAANTAVASERKRISDITAICQKAGKPEMAQQYIDNGAEVGVVQSAMFDILCQNRPPVGDAGGNDIQQQADPEKQWKAEYAADRATYMRAGITEENYLQSRRIDAGLEPLVTR